MIDVVLIHFSILCLGITLNLIALILTLYLKNVQIWPPPGKFSSQFWFTWISFTYFMMGIPVLGILDYGSSKEKLPPWVFIDLHAIPSM